MSSRAARPGRRLLLLVLVWCALVALGYAGMRHSTVAADLEGSLLDIRFGLRGPIEPSGQVVLIAIDDRTLAATGDWPMSRSVIADAVSALDAAGARVIVLDLLLAELERPSTAGGTGPGDQRLIDALRASGRVALAFAFAPEEAGPVSRLPAIERGAVGLVEIPPGTPALTPFLPSGLIAPFPALASAASGLGHVTIVLDADGTLRQHLPVIRFGDTYYMSLAVEALRQWLDVPRSQVRLLIGDGLTVGDLRIPLGTDMSIGIDPYGVYRALPSISMIDLLRGEESALRRVDGRIAVVGATATGVGDRYRSSYAASQPGVGYFAATIDNLVSGRFLRQGLDVQAADIGLIFAVGFAVGLLGRATSPLVAVTGAAVVLGLLLILLQLAFTAERVALNALFPILSWLGTVILVVTARMTTEHQLWRSAEIQRRRMERYLPGLAAAAASSSDGHRPTAVQPAAILFIDLQGYTSLSERVGPERSAELINQYYGLVEQVVEEHGGVIDKFIGDGAMIVFGAGKQRIDEAAHALACARTLIDRIGSWAREVSGESTPLSARVGLHYGPVQISALGGSHLQVTAMGDTVNVASRLEQMTRIHGAVIAASTAVIESARAVGRADLVEGFRSLPDQAIRGRAEPMTLWLLPAEPKPAEGAPA